MLTVYRVDSQSARPDAKNEGILERVEESVQRVITFLDMATLERTDPSYSVFRCTVKFNVDFLCSCCRRPKITRGFAGCWLAAS